MKRSIEISIKNYEYRPLKPKARVATKVIIEEALHVAS